tara:strand:- start:4368 stop:4664 length:297 start_codon:yes stop_codon:yes gene_type:complete
MSELHPNLRGDRVLGTVPGAVLGTIRHCTTYHYGVICILVQVLWRYAAMLAFCHVAQTGKESFYHIGLLAEVAVDFGAVHTINHSVIVQRIAAGSLVG